MDRINLIISLGHVCSTAELIKSNGAKNCSFIFDWARSNIMSNIDVIKYGHEWHILNNIERDNSTHYEEYQYGNIEFPHHSGINIREKSDNDYLIRCSERFFKALNSNYNISFLYLSDKINKIRDWKDHEIEGEPLNLLIETIKEKYPKLKFEINIVYYIGIGDSVKLVEDEKYYKIYECEAPKQFVSNNMRGINYVNLFKNIYNNLDIKEL